MNLRDHRAARRAGRDDSVKFILRNFHLGQVESEHQAQVADFLFFWRPPADHAILAFFLRPRDPLGAFGAGAVIQETRKGPEARLLDASEEGLGLLAGERPDIF